MPIASADQEASTVAVTRSCFEKFQQYIQQTDGNTRTHIRTRLADLRLWADSVGAVAHEKASLDYRFQHRLDDIKVIRNLLSMLEGFLEDMGKCFLAAKHEADLQDIMTNIDSIIDTLAFIGVQIRRSGRKSRIRKADSSFDQNRRRYRNLRAHLACVVLARPTEEGRPKDEGKDIHSVDYFAEVKLSPIQERLIEANLRRRHRFKEAQRHSGRLKDHSGNAGPPVIPQHFIAMSMKQHENQDISPFQDKHIAAAMRQQSSRPDPKKEDTHTIAPTSASGLDSKWGGLQGKWRPGPTATRITSTTAKMRYPRARKMSDAEQKLAKCPCCCQAIPATELEGSHWRKHVANDLCPYTCVVANCPTPYNLFVTQDEWNDHVINDHPSHWQCPCCGDGTLISESISGITHHLMTEHPDEAETSLEEFLLDAEINITGITNCPLCDSEGPQDSLDLMEHVLQHVHDFSLRSLPWPADLPITLDKSAGLFDMSHAVKSVKDNEGNVFKHDIASWAEHVVPTFDQSRGRLISYDEEGKEFVMSTASTIEASGRWTSLQFCDVDRNTLENEEDSTQQDPSREEYFSELGNDYFVDESSVGRFSQTYHSPQQSDATEGSTEHHGPKRWVCPMCHAQSTSESLGEKSFFEHLIPRHAVEQAEIDSSGGEDKWMRYMLAEAYWLGMEADSTSAVEEIEKDLNGEDSAALSSVGKLTDQPQHPKFPILVSNGVDAMDLEASLYSEEFFWRKPQDPKKHDENELLDREEVSLREPQDSKSTIGLYNEKIPEEDMLSRLERLLIGQQNAREEKKHLAAALYLEAKGAYGEAEVKAAKEAEETKAAYEKALTEAKTTAEELEKAKEACNEAETEVAKEVEETKVAYTKALGEYKTAVEELEKVKTACREAEIEATKEVKETKAAYKKALAELETAREESETAINLAKEEAAKLGPSKDPLLQIKYKDAIGRKFSLSWEICQTWKGMEMLINQAFSHADIIDPLVHQGQYDLISPDGEIILPQVWETMIQPGWLITMNMWPVPEPPPPPPPPDVQPLPVDQI